MNKLGTLWRRCFYWFINHVYFARITVLHPERRPERGPVLYLGLHRNGAVDGFVYNEALRGPTFMISTQLRKSWFARLFFTGITVARAKDDGDRSQNDQALRECLSLLRRGGSLFVFPEGTSSLGPRHLPFKSGALWLILEYLQTPGPELRVIPVGIHYECAWAFRAKVEVVLGKPLDLNGVSRAVPNNAARPTLPMLKALKRSAQSALDEVGINVGSDQYQTAIQKLAYVSTLATPRSYFGSLKALEKQIPGPISSAGEELEMGLQGKPLLVHQGVPLVPMGPALLYVFALVMFGPIVVVALLLNAPPLLAGFFAGRKFPDDVNVISLWRILVGIPAFISWIGFVCVLCLTLGNPLWLLIYAVLTWTGLQLYYRVKKLAVAVHNGLRYPKLRPVMLQFRETVIRNLPDDPLVAPESARK